MKKYNLTINGNSYHVDIKEATGNTIHMEVNGSAYEVELEKEIKTSKTPTLVMSQPKPSNKPTAESLKSSESTKKLTAPLPGVILKVNVKEGDEVKTGDNLLILEAMKMENTVLAEYSGTIKNMNVKEGQSVLQGDVLLEIV